MKVLEDMKANKFVRAQVRKGKPSSIPSFSEVRVETEKLWLNILNIKGIWCLFNYTIIHSTFLKLACILLKSISMK